jgi:hypothetical protein
MKFKPINVLLGGAALLIFAGPAAAAFTFVGKFEGNDCAGVLGSPFAACEYQDSPIIAKYDVETGGWQVNDTVFGDDVSAGQFTLNFNSGNTSGTWSYSGVIAISAYVLKAGDEFAVFATDAPSNSFSNIAWSTAAGNLVNPNNGNPRELSHISFYDTEGVPPDEVPLPAAAWLFLSGLIPLAGFLRKRREVLAA